MIRVRQLAKYVPDERLRIRLIEKLSEIRGFPGGSIPEWFELDEADFADLLNELKLEDAGPEKFDDPRD